MSEMNLAYKNVIVRIISTRWYHFINGNVKEVFRGCFVDELVEKRIKCRAIYPPWRDHGQSISKCLWEHIT